MGARKAREAVDGALAEAAKGRGSTLLVRAGYGKGKSHLGRLARELALEQRIATMHLELDGQGLTLGTGALWLSSLFGSVTLPAVTGEDEHLVTGLGTVLRRAAPRAKPLPERLALFGPFLDRTERWVESEDAVVVLERYLSGDLNVDASRSGGGRPRQRAGDRAFLGSDPAADEHALPGDERGEAARRGGASSGIGLRCAWGVAGGAARRLGMAG